MRADHLSLIANDANSRSIMNKWGATIQQNMLKKFYLSFSRQIFEKIYWSERMNNTFQKEQNCKVFFLNSLYTTRYCERESETNFIIASLYSYPATLRLISLFMRRYSHLRCHGKYALPDWEENESRRIQQRYIRRKGEQV
jgi:hypothetical protein